MFSHRATVIILIHTLVLGAILPIFREVVQEATVGDKNNFLLGASLQPAACGASALLEGVVRGRIATCL